MCPLVAGDCGGGDPGLQRELDRRAEQAAEYFARVAAVCRLYGPQSDKIDPPHDIAIPGEVVGPAQVVLPLIVAQTRDNKD